jgi:23S rRNA pseudouridine1911/1915/1917 synthase
MSDSIKIIYEDTDVLVIHKPVGMLVHADGGDATDTVVAWLLQEHPEAVGVGEEQRTSKGVLVDRSGVVHRLDRDTSGVLVLAKHQEAYVHLKAQFHDRLVKKEYRAFVYGAVRERWGTIDRPIGRSAKDWRIRSAQHGAKGELRDAVTNWECIGTGQYEGELFSYLKLMPKTGRMHQLRVHLKAIDRPIVGDMLYAPSYIEQSNNLDLTRLALHAHVLECTLPSGATERFIDPVPPEFELAAEHIAEQ